MKNLISSKTRIPISKKIQIDNIKEVDPYLKEFLEVCIPNKIELFSINWFSLSNKAIRMRYSIRYWMSLQYYMVLIYIIAYKNIFL